MSAEAGPPTVLECLKRGTSFLAERGVDNPRLDAELLIADAIGVDRVGVYLNFDRPMEAGELETSRRAIARRGKREPLQYIRGRQEFFGRDFAVSAGVLVPRSDTETLVEAVLRQSLPRARVLELGCGSGCVALSIALERPEWSVVASEISEAAAKIARRNADTLGASLDLRSGDLFAPVASETFDIIVSNPPYIPRAEIDELEAEVRDHEPRLALDGGDDGLELIRRILDESPPHLNSPGVLALEVGAGQAAEVAAAAESRGWSCDEVVSDLSGVERVVVLSRPKREGN